MHIYHVDDFSLSHSLLSELPKTLEMRCERYVMHGDQFMPDKN